MIGFLDKAFSVYQASTKDKFTLLKIKRSVVRKCSSVTILLSEKIFSLLKEKYREHEIHHFLTENFLLTQNNTGRECSFDNG